MTGRKPSPLLAAGARTVGVAWVRGCRRGGAVAVAVVLVLAVAGSTPALAATPESTASTHGLGVR